MKWTRITDCSYEAMLVRLLCILPNLIADVNIILINSSPKLLQSITCSSSLTLASRASSARALSSAAAPADSILSTHLSASSAFAFCKRCSFVPAGALCYVHSSDSLQGRRLPCYVPPPRHSRLPLPIPPAQSNDAILIYPSLQSPLNNQPLHGQCQTVVLKCKQRLAH